MPKRLQKDGDHVKKAMGAERFSHHHHDQTMSSSSSSSEISCEDYLSEEQEEIVESNEDDEVVESDEDDALSNASDNVRPFIPGSNEQHDKLECNLEAYDLFHRLMLDWSCYSFDVLPDALGANRSLFPHTIYMVAGTQILTDETDHDVKNRVYVMKCKNLTKVKADVDSQSDSTEKEHEKHNYDYEDAALDFRCFIHPGNVNRLKICPQLPRLVSTWSDDGHIYIWDIQEHKTMLELPGNTPKMSLIPKYKFFNTCEGYGLNFNTQQTGVLAAGSRDHTIRLFKPVQGGWEVERPIAFHKGSVEDVAFKRLGSPNILASCSTDRSIGIFDISHYNKVPQIHIPNAHTDDVNAINWSPFEENHLLSGGDDGVVRVWDIRNASEPITHLEWHKKPISSVDWHPTDPAVFAVASLDNSVSIWDMSVESSEEVHHHNSFIPESYPSQLMFHHMGQTHISEVKWHAQIPGLMISTAEDGMNIFKPCNI